MNADAIREEYKKGVDISVFKDSPFILLKKGDRIRTILDEYFKKRRKIYRRGIQAHKQKRISHQIQAS